MNKTISLFFILPLIFFCYKNSLADDSYSIIGKWQGKEEKIQKWQGEDEKTQIEKIQITITLIFYPDSTVRVLTDVNDKQSESLKKYKIDENLVIVFSDDPAEPMKIEFLDKDTMMMQYLKRKTRMYEKIMYAMKYKRVK